MKYEILEHTADLKIRAFGRDKKALFENTMIGMFEGGEYKTKVKSIPSGSTAVQQKSKVKIKIKSIDLLSLLVDFLSEVLYLSEVNREVYESVQFEKFTEKNLEGFLFGKKLERIGVQIKGVTYHDLEIKQREDGGWEATVLFDI